MFVDDEHAIQELLKMHAHKIKHDKQRCAYILHMPKDRVVSFDAFFIRYELDDVLRAFKTENRTVQWFLHQLQTFQCEEEVLAGAALPSGDIMTLVFPSIKYSGSLRT